VSQATDEQVDVDVAAGEDEGCEVQFTFVLSINGREVKRIEGKRCGRPMISLVLVECPTCGSVRIRICAKHWKRLATRWPNWKTPGAAVDVVVTALCPTCDGVSTWRYGDT
jgi:predicted RNA-binding Zn-ribbon protein involved in translation (DUF1610 family)